MIAISDGKLTFDTRINEKGFDDGVKNLSSKQISLQNSIKKTVAEMQKLENSMNSAKDAKVPTEEYAELQSACSKAEAQLNRYLATETRMKETGAKLGGQSWRNLQYNIEEARNTVKAYQADMKYMENGGIAFKDADTSGMQNKYDLLKSKLSEYQAKLQESISKDSAKASSNISLSKSFNRVISACQKFASIIASISSKLGRMAIESGKAGIKLLSLINPLKGIKKHSESTGNSFDKFGKRILGLAKTALVFSLIRSSLNGLRKYLQNVLMSNKEFSNSLAQVKGNLLTAFQPILETIMPVLNTFMSALATVTGYIAQFMSLLFGKNITATRKAASAQYEQAKAMEKTSKSAKELKKDLSDIDELHNISSQKDSSNGSGSGGGSKTLQPDFTYDWKMSDQTAKIVQMLKDAWDNADFTDVGITVGQKLTDTLDSINWTDIQEKTDKIAYCIASFLNGSIDGTDWGTVGKTVSRCVNIILGFFETFVNEFDYKALGLAIGNFVNNAIESTNWGKLTNVLSGHANGVFKTINNATKVIHWKTIGEKLGKNFEALIDKIDFDTAKDTIDSGLKGMADLISGFNSRVDWTDVGSKCADLLNGAFKTITSNRFLTGATSFVNAAINAIKGFVDTTDWSGIGTGIANVINKAVKGVQWETAFKSGMKVALGILKALKSAIRRTDWSALMDKICDCLEEVPWKELGNELKDLLEACIALKNDAIYELGKRIGGWLWDGIKAGVSGIGGYLSDIVDKDTYTPKAIKGRAKEFIGFFTNIFSTGEEDMKKTMEDQGRELGSYTLEGLEDGVSKKVDTWKEINSIMKGGIQENIIDSSKDTLGVHSPSRVMKEIGQYTIDGLKNGIKEKWTLLKDYFATIPSKMVSTFDGIKNKFTTKGSSIISGLKSGVSTNLKSLKDYLGLIPGSLSKSVTGMKDKFLSKGSQIISGIKKGWTDGFPTFKEYLKTIPDKIQNGIGSITSVGKNLVEGLWNGINDKTSWLQNKLTSFGSSATNALKDFFGIHSPSRLFRDQIGTYLAQGIGVGFENEMGIVTKDMMNSCPNGLSDLGIDINKFQIPDIALGKVIPTSTTLINANYEAEKNNNTDLLQSIRELTNRIETMQQWEPKIELVGEMSKLFSAILKENTSNLKAGRSSLMPN